jgi:uncharacterized protein (DUF924 family)
MPQNYSAVISFWFHELTPKDWWRKDPDLDRQIAARFLSTHTAAAQCELYEWRSNPLGRLAEVIVLDQFSRNIFRGSARAFQHDSLALCLAQTAIAANAHEALNATQKAFLYMPFMHSESSTIHKVGVKLFAEPGLEWNLDFELKHKAMIDRFGRYPHRNGILERKSTREELDFLKEPGSAF